MYIIIEGIDTAGKSTQLDILKRNHPDIIFTKEPGGTQIGQELREMVLNGRAKSKIAEMLIFLADRALVVTTPDVSAVRDADRVIGIIDAKSQKAKVESYCQIQLQYHLLQQSYLAYF